MGAHSLALSPRTLHGGLQLSKVPPEKWPVETYSFTASPTPRKPETQARGKHPIICAQGLEQSRNPGNKTIGKRKRISPRAEGAAGALAICQKNHLWLSKRGSDMCQAVDLFYLSFIYLFNKHSQSARHHSKHLSDINSLNPYYHLGVDGIIFPILQKTNPKNKLKVLSWRETSIQSQTAWL